jgi:hypothetical protein
MKKGNMKNCCRLKKLVIKVKRWMRRKMEKSNNAF